MVFGIEVVFEHPLYLFFFFEVLQMEVLETALKYLKNHILKIPLNF